MFKKIIFIFLLISIIAGTSGCRKIKKDSSNDIINVKKELVSLDGEIVDFGKTDFTVDSSNRVSREYYPEEDLLLEMVDNTGIKWSLTIPSDALLDITTISMTALTNIRNDVLGKFDGGIQLEPDGLTFLSPVIIKVSGNNIEENGVFYISNNDGSATEISNTSYTEDGVYSNIFHFSNAFCQNGDQQGLNFSDYDKEEREKKANQAKNQKQKSALQRLKLCEEEIERINQSSLNVPEPPSISLVCLEDPEKYAIPLFTFIEAFLNPEKEVLEKYLNAEYAYLDSFEEPYNSQPYKEVLVERWVKKLEKLLDTYANEAGADKFIAVYKAYKSYQKSYDLIKIGSTSERQHDQDNAFKKWAETIVERYIRELRDNHDYKALSGAFACLKYIKLDNRFSEEIIKALTFKVEFENIITAESIEYKVEGEAVVTFPSYEILDNFIFNGDNGIFIGKGTGNYTNFKSPEPNLQLAMPNSFPINPAVTDYRPCKSDEINIHIDAFGTDMETFITPGGAAPTNGVVKASSMLLFDKYRRLEELISYRLPYLYYKFPMTLQNGEEIAAEKTFTENYNNLSVKYKLKLVHAPN